MLDFHVKLDFHRPGALIIVQPDYIAFMGRSLVFIWMIPRTLYVGIKVSGLFLKKIYDPSQEYQKDH